jgi:hypothetical protein
MSWVRVLKIVSEAENVSWVRVQVMISLARNVGTIEEQEQDQSCLFRRTDYRKKRHIPQKVSSDLASVKEVL